MRPLPGCAGSGPAAPTAVPGPRAVAPGLLRIAHRGEDMFGDLLGGVMRPLVRVGRHILRG
jgi:hypothetical protein